MTRRLRIASFLLATAVATSAWAQGQNTAPPPPSTTMTTTTTSPPRSTTDLAPTTPAGSAAPAEADGTRKRGLTPLSMDPAAPEMSSLPGGVTPAFGALSTKPGDWRFDYHGLLYVPLRMGFNTRLHPTAGQEKVVVHSPPIIPEDFTTFGYTNVEPGPWGQVNFSYGNRDVTATVIIAARTFAEGESFYNPPDHLGIDDAFVTFREITTGDLRMKLDVGAFANRYGNMGEYDSGRYGTPVIARIGGVGATQTASYRATPDWTLLGEIGLMGQLNKAPLGVEPAGWNGYLDPSAGTSFVPHLHAGFSYRSLAQFGAHFLRALTQDDRATPNTQPDGYIDVYAADARLTMRRYGHLYFAASEVSSHHARAVSDVIQILNAPGGGSCPDPTVCYGLMSRDYFGPNSNGGGDLTILAGQYDLSVGNLLRYPSSYEGMGPDLFVSLFGIFTAVDSADHSVDPTTGAKLYDGIKKLKYGAEVSYTPFGWLALSGRYDRVIGNLGDARTTTAILSPRLIFRSGYNARDQLVLQYSHWFNGSGVLVSSGAPPRPDPTVRPDVDVLSLMVSMWW